MTGSPLSRRRLLAGTVGLAGWAGLVAACSSAPPPAPAPPAGSPAPPAPPATSTPAASGTYTGDQQTVALCAALATLVADLYADAASVAAQGRLGPVPGAVAALLSGAGGQHTAAAQAWNQVLTAAGRPAVSGTPLTVEPQYRQRLAAVAAPVDLLGLAADLEATVGATVIAAMGRFTDPAAVAVGAGVAPVAAMHAATASFLLGRLPTAPADPTAGALGPDVLTA